MEPKIFICSDWHFCHNKDFLLNPRGFSSAEEMNEAIIERHNQVVRPGDIVYHLGDEILSDTKKGIECINRLNGEIHLIRGNHTTDNRVKEILKKCPNVKEADLYSKMIKYKKYSFLLSHFPTIVGNYDDIERKNKLYCLCGHTHTNDPFLDYSKKCFHVEMETRNCCPWEIEEIITFIKCQNLTL